MTHYPDPDAPALTLCGQPRADGVTITESQSWQIACDACFQSRFALESGVCLQPALVDVAAINARRAAQGKLPVLRRTR